MRSCNANVTDIASCVCMELRVPVAFAIKVSLLAKSWPEGHLGSSLCINSRTAAYACLESRPVMAHALTRHVIIQLTRDNLYT